MTGSGACGRAGGLVPRRSRPVAAPRAAAGQRGMVSVEAAIVIPALLGMGLLAAGAPAVVGAQIRCSDAAREAALMIARDVAAAEVAAAVGTLAPDGAQMSVEEHAGTVQVVVEAQVRPAPGPLGRMMALDVSGRSVAMREYVAEP